MTNDHNTNHPKRTARAWRPDERSNRAQLELDARGKPPRQHASDRVVAPHPRG